MKRILVTGANSYIGTYIEKYLSRLPEAYQVETLDMLDGAWKEKSFQGYDVVFHVAGIVHQKETKENAQLYYQVNRNLAIEVAKKSKQQGVKQFIFLSTMSVYGINVGVITRDTKLNPKSNYAKSKLEAEEALKELEGASMKLCILRPPMVYGEGCKGNFPILVRFVEKMPVFPKVKNQRSMIYIEHLAAFIQLLIDKECQGTYFPQNKEYVQTIQIARAVARKRDKKVYFSVILGMGIFMLRPVLSIVQKSFGSLIYKDMEDFDFTYCTKSFEESMDQSI